MSHHQELVTVTDWYTGPSGITTTQEGAVTDNSNVFTFQVQVITSPDEGAKTVQEGQSKTYTQVQDEVLEKTEERDNELVLEEERQMKWLSKMRVWTKERREIMTWYRRKKMVGWRQTTWRQQIRSGDRRETRIDRNRIEGRIASVQVRHGWEKWQGIWCRLWVGRVA